jgi:signal transduction histidine kinase/DNA-binding NarL/FixJ family response regulator
MLLPGTQMHMITFIFVSIEIVIFFYLVIYKLARPSDTSATLNLILISLLIIYNVSGGLLPDPNLSGSAFIQETIAYGTGFITPCFFPYYVYKAFALEKMRFHAFRGVFLFLALPYFIFVITYAFSGSLQLAKNLLGIPVVYAIWVIISLLHSIRYKYKNDFSSLASKEEITVLLLSLTPWIGLPVVSYFNLSQAVEACITNPGFLILLALEVNRQIKQLRKEHERLIDSELKLLNWNINLQKEVNRRTWELEKINEQKTHTFVNLAHEIKTPLTLIDNYLEEYIEKKGPSEELDIVKKNIEKLSADIVNFFDLERFSKNLPVYNHNQASDFSGVINDILALFKEFAAKRNIHLNATIKNGLFIKGDPLSVNRIVNNLIENAIKFSSADSEIVVRLYDDNGKIIFSVKDYGVGIPPELHKKVFEPYFQITKKKSSIQGMGLGLPIVKKVVEDLGGQISIVNNPDEKGVCVSVMLSKHENILKGVETYSVRVNNLMHMPEVKTSATEHNSDKYSILVVEDNPSMINYLIKKLQVNYNAYASVNGHEAIKMLKSLRIIPDLIISDIMMDTLDGFNFIKIISKYLSYNHIPVIFLSAKSTNEDKLYGLGLGAIDFIQKPFKINYLLKKIDSVLNNAQKQKDTVLRVTFNNLKNQEILARKGSKELFNQNCDLYNLTSREKGIVKLISDGLKYKTIADTLFISERTVTKHVQNIFEKLQVSNKIELINKLEAA